MAPLLRGSGAASGVLQRRAPPPTYPLRLPRAGAILRPPVQAGVHATGHVQGRGGLGLAASLPGGIGGGQGLGVAQAQRLDLGVGRRPVVETLLGLGQGVRRLRRRGLGTFLRQDRATEGGPAISRDHLARPRPARRRPPERAGRHPADGRSGEPRQPSPRCTARAAGLPPPPPVPPAGLTRTAPRGPAAAAAARPAVPRPPRERPGTARPRARRAGPPPRPRPGRGRRGPPAPRPPRSGPTPPPAPRPPSCALLHVLQAVLEKALPGLPVLTAALPRAPARGTGRPPAGGGRTAGASTARDHASA